jgi:PAS domain S-box-containing protein
MDIPTLAPDLPPSDAAQEARRMAVLRSLEVLDSPAEPVFEAIAASAAAACGAPIALVSLVDAHRQWFKARVGLPVAETPREFAFCDHAIRGTTPFEVPDATQDRRFADNPLVLGDPGIRFYAGVPIVMPGGERIGTVCVIDRAPRRLEAQQRTLLEGLAAIAATTLAQRRDLLDTARRLAAERNASSEQRLRRLYEATPAIMHSIDTKGCLLDVSDRWLAWLGYRRDEVVGRRSSEFLTPASQAHARDVVLPAFFRTGRCDRVAYQFVRRDGTLLDVLLSASLERDDRGEPVRSLAVLEDVTEQMRLEAELGRTHAHLDAVLDNMPALVGYWDAQAVTRFANRDFQAALGLPLDAIIGRSLAEIIGAIDPQGYEDLAPRVAAVLAGRRQEFEGAMLTTAGLRQLRVTLVPAQPQPGRIDGFYGNWFDITGMKALALRQRDSELRYRALSENLGSGYALGTIEVDETGRPVDFWLLAVNPAFCTLFGIDAAAGAVGARATALFPQAADPVDWIGRLGEVALTGRPAHFEHRSAVSGRWFEVTAYRTEPGQFAVIVQDISAQKQVEAALAQARAALAQGAPTA